MAMKNNMIYPCLWFDGKAKEASDFYCSAFDNSVITYQNQMVVIFESYGQKFMCLNGGPEFTFNPSVSFYVICKTEGEINRLRKHLIEGGSELMPMDKYDWSTKYVWLQDKFGVNWQLSYGGIEQTPQKFSPVLMFTDKQVGKADQAIHFYTSIFEGSDIIGIVNYTKDDNDIEGTVKHAEFTLGTHAFMAMDSSNMHQFSFNEAISLVVECETQEEIDYYWDRLTDSGEEIQCGWLKDKFGVSWQIVPTILSGLMSDPSRSERVTNAFLQMKKFDIEKLLKA
jgi:predicted 3-demethylubiquinone-9 3-methyltransferase (glyoxalase superfamily)